MANEGFLQEALDQLPEERKIFHSEADFQFALAWKIQTILPAAEIRLEYPFPEDCQKHIDILVRHKGVAFPIELKYKTKRALYCDNGETYELKSHGAQNLAAYDFIKDLQRLESFVVARNDYKYGYALWLTNDQWYWNEPRDRGAGCAAFSVEEGVKKAGDMDWGPTIKDSSKKGREMPLHLDGSYEIRWKPYSDLSMNNGLFRYALIRVAIGANE